MIDPRGYVSVRQLDYFHSHNRVKIKKIVKDKFYYDYYDYYLLKQGKDQTTFENCH